MSEIDEYVRNHLRRQSKRWQEVAISSGVSYEWIRRFMKGAIPNPGINTLRKLRDHFRVTR